MTKDVRSAAIALYDRFTHEDRWDGLPPADRDRSGGAIDPPMDRRVFMTELTRLAGGAAAASALLAGIAASPAAAAIVPAEDPRVRARRMQWPVGNGRMMKGYLADPANPAPNLASVLVIHENRGLNAHIEDVARRLAIANFRALAADFLSPSGGTPTDEDQARAAIGKLDPAQAAADAVATLAMLKTLPGGNGRVGAIGFCWGGGMVNRVAVLAGNVLDAGSPFYGPGQDPSLAPRVEAAMLLHHAGLDDRVNQTGLPWAAALKAAGKQVEEITYPSVNHAFHNDTSAERYNKEAADRAWQTTLRFLRASLG